MKKILLIWTLIFGSIENVYSHEQFVATDKQQIKSEKSKIQTKKRRISVKALCKGVSKAEKALKINPFDANSIWDLDILNKEVELAELLHKFLEGQYAAKARSLDLSNKTKEEVVEILLKEGFKKQTASPGNILAKTSDRNPQEPGEIYQHEDGSLVRIKPYSEKRKYRPQAYIVKAVTKNPESPATWTNEAFKVSVNGHPIPKAPKAEYGMKMRPVLSQSNDEDQGWVDLVMEEVHIDLRVE
ncbi:MAG: hypothetical protein SFT68_04985 [Rickettsiaceae bacterium]|nr:hypothetical protein [Rickettsiaceae bacterium]